MFACFCTVIISAQRLFDNPVLLSWKYEAITAATESNQIRAWTTEESVFDSWRDQDIFPLFQSAQTPNGAQPLPSTHRGFFLRD
jgi:hypothetical protein